MNLLMLLGFSKRLKGLGGWRLGFGFRLTWWNVLVLGTIILVCGIIKYMLLAFGWMIYGMVWLPVMIYYWLFKGLFGAGKLAVKAGMAAKESHKDLDVETNTGNLDQDTLELETTKNDWHIRKPALIPALLGGAAVLNSYWVLLVNHSNGGFLFGAFLSAILFYIAYRLQGSPPLDSSGLAGSRKWYQAPITTFIFLFVLPPLGIFFMIRYQTWAKQTKIVYTIVAVLLFAFILFLPMK